MKQHLVIALTVGLWLSLLAGCAAPAAPAIAVENPWGRPSPTMPGAGGLFMVIKNTGTADEKLVSGKSPACGMVEIHEMVKKADGTMGMNLVSDPVVVPASGQVELKSGSLHIMCMQMNADQFKPGNKVSLTLQFEKSGEKTVTAEIRAE